MKIFALCYLRIILLKFFKKLNILKSHVSNIEIVVDYTPSEVSKSFQFASTKPQRLVLQQNNNYLNFDFDDFELKHSKTDKIVLRFQPKLIGTFRVLAVFYKVFNIPRFFTFDNEFNSMNYFVSYFHQLGDFDSSFSAIGNISKFTNIHKESTSLNCLVIRFHCS